MRERMLVFVNMCAQMSVNGGGEARGDWLPSRRPLLACTRLDHAGSRVFEFGGGRERVPMELAFAPEAYWLAK